MKDILGTIPRDFTRYWTQRFPHLVSHSFHALETCAAETIFQTYYNDSYTFAKPNYFYGGDEEFVPLETAPKLARESPVRKYAKDIRQRFVQRSPLQSDGWETAGTGSDAARNIAPNRRGVYNFKVDTIATEPSSPATVTWENWRSNRKKSTTKDSTVAWTLPNSEAQ